MYSSICFFLISLNVFAAKIENPFQGIDFVDFQRRIPYQNQKSTAFTVLSF